MCANGTISCQNVAGIIANEVLDIVNAPSCFIEVSTPSFAPARTSLVNALNSLSGSQQQGSSLSGSASTNAVSKPSGPTALIEEFGGANATTGTSSSTVQWSPGTMFTNLALTGVQSLCLSKGEPTGCISPSLLKNLAPLTFKITAYTSSGSSSLAGTATTPSSTSPSQPVSVNSKGASGPGFAGLTVQYSFFGRTQAGVSSLTKQPTQSTTQLSTTVQNAATPKPAANAAVGTPAAGTPAAGTPAAGAPAAGAAAAPAPQYYLNELAAANKLIRDLPNCTAYNDWSTKALDDFAHSGSLAAGHTDSLQQLIEQEYRLLWGELEQAPLCQPTIEDLRNLFATILEAETYEDFAAVEQSSAKPELALEYDLNTPQNQPSYSSAKITANWQFGKSTPTATIPATAKPSAAAKAVQTQQQITQLAQSQTALASSATVGAPGSEKQAAANAKPVAQANAQPWSLTLTGAADIYHSQPPSSVPSGSHLRDIQAGAEISYLFSPSANSSALRSFIGPITAAAAYSYQDQTSPAILTGPALTDFTGLPSSTTSAYTKRGVIHLGQVRLGFGTGSNTTFPLAFTYSNRTELITHSVWGVQFGVSYNFTSLFTSSGTSKGGGS